MTASETTTATVDRSVLERAADGDRAALARTTAALQDTAAHGLLGQQLGALAPQTATELLLRLGPKDARRMLRALPDGPGLAVLLRLDSGVRTRLLGDFGPGRLRSFLARISPSATADVLAGLPAATVDALLADHPEARRIRAAIAYGHGTAGAAMHRAELVTVPLHGTVGTAVEAVREHSDDVERMPAVFVVDDADGRLIGSLRLRDLVLHPRSTPIGEVVHRDAVTVAVDADQEEVVRVADDARLPAVVVIDRARRPLGIVSAHELRDIVRDEATEDIKALSSAAVDSAEQDTPLRILRTRFPWLVSALIGAIGAGFIIGWFEHELEQAVILASLIPMCMDMAGNAGIQSSAVTIEALASRDSWRGDLVGRFFRELFGALLNGAAVGLVTAIGIVVIGLFTDIPESGWLALTAAATLVAIIVQAAIVGVVIPLVLKRLKLDPAVGTGVFITTINDFAGIALLFTFASLIYLPHI